MAKDDYDVIVYRVLVYLYGCLKRKIMYEEATFQEAVKKHAVSDTYFYDVLRMMQDDRLIEGLIFTSAWGGDVIILTDLRDMKITTYGIKYIQDNAKMKQIGEALKDAVDIIAKLASILALI